MKNCYPRGWAAFSGLFLLACILLFMLGCGSGTPSETTTTPPSNNFQSVTLTRLSQDRFTNVSSQHATEVEPGLYAFGSTMVTAFQVGRISSGGGADIGFATSTDAGTTWNSGYLRHYNFSGSRLLQRSQRCRRCLRRRPCRVDDLIPRNQCHGSSARKPLAGRNQLGKSNRRQHKRRHRQKLDRLRQHARQPLLRSLLRGVGRSLESGHH